MRLPCSQSQPLEVGSLEKSFGQISVLKGVSASFKPGSISGIVGGSGSGKSVLAKCIVGLLHADAGSVVYPGSETNTKISFPAPSFERWPEIRRKINYVSQTRAVAPYRRVIDLVKEGPIHVLGVDDARAQEKAMDLLYEFGVQQHASKYPTEVSGGELTRICIARSMAVDPDFLICDEIFANLDPLSSEKVGQAMIRATEVGVGVILISHQLNFLREFGENVIFLNEGKVWEGGLANKLLSQPSSNELAEFVRLSKLV